jgi:hypothetical protein
MGLKLWLTILFSLHLFLSHGQALTYENGKIKDSNNKKISNSQVRELLSSHPQLLKQYSQGQTKASIGGLFLGFGIGFIAADLLTGATQDKVYPSAFTYIGIASALISIPITIGYSKKIKSAINGYNESLQTKKVGMKIEKLNIITNQNGIGMQISF